MKKLVVIATVVALAFGGAGFALGVSTGARAEDGQREAAEVTRTTVRTTAVRAPEPAPVTPPRVEAPRVEATTPRPAVAVRDDVAEPARLRVRRLVVTSGIAGHEPDGSIGTMAVGEHERVFAFVELANGGGAGSVVVTFERDGATPTGNVELDVPERVGRWRTWAFSRGVTSAGEWRAVVRDVDGRLLAEEPFVVE